MTTVEVATSRIRVFVAFRRSDGTQSARAIVRHLVNGGYMAFADLPDDGVQSSYDEIKANLSSSNVVIFIDTPEAATSPWVLEELRETLAKGRPLIWLRLGTARDRINLPLDTKRYPDYFSADEQIGTAQLAFVDSMLAKLGEPTRGRP